MKGTLGFQIVPEQEDRTEQIAADDVLDGMKRFETSATITRFKIDRNLLPVRFLRDGLGVWSGVAAQTSKGPLIIAVSENRPHTGASIWAPQPMTLRDAAGLVTRLAKKGDPLLFMTPEGRMIKPADSPRPTIAVATPGKDSGIRTDLAASRRLIRRS